MATTRKPPAKKPPAKKPASKAPARKGASHAEAGAKGGSKPRKALTVAQRHATVVRLRARGRTWLHIAEQVGLSDRQCRQIWTDWVAQEKPLLEGLDALDYVTEQAARLEQQVEDLGEIADTEKGSLKIQALNAQRQTMRELTELLQSTGLIPHNLGKVQVELDIRYLGIMLMEWAEKFVPADQLDGAFGELRELLRGQEQPRPELRVVGDDG